MTNVSIRAASEFEVTKSGPYEHPRPTFMPPSAPCLEDWSLSMSTSVAGTQLLILNSDRSRIADETMRFYFDGTCADG